MKEDWNRRAREKPRFYIATSVADSEGAFEASGERDAQLLFDGLEGLLLGSEILALDIGCGIGRMDRYVAPLVGRLTGLDVSGEMVSQARERLADVPNVDFIEGDGWTLQPVGDDSFELVFSCIVFQHVPRAVTASYFREVRRVLRTGGHFLFQMPEVARDGPPDPPDDDTFEMRFYEEGDLRDQLGALDMDVIECRRYPVESSHLRFNQLRILAKRR